VISALALIIFAVIGNNIIIRKTPEGIVSETAYIALILTAAQARNSLIDFITVWGELATLKKKRKSSITTNSNLVNSGANKDDKNDNRHIIGGEKDSKRKRTCEAKAKSESKKIKKQE
jgi:hypothetical protein